MRRLSTIPLQYLAALLLAVLIGGGIYALRGSGGATASLPNSAPAATAHSRTIVHMPVTANPARPARPNGEASKSPKQILADAASALRAASGFELHGTQTVRGKTVRIRALASGQSLDLAVATGTAAYEMLRVPTGFYVRANASFWRQHLGARGAVLADRWIHRSSPALASELNDFAPGRLARCLAEDTGRLSVAGTTSINGQPAILIKDAGNLPGSAPGTLAVATTGPPYPLREAGAGRQRPGGRVDVCNDGHGSGYETGSVTLGEFNQIPPLEPPTDALEVPGPPLS